MRKISRLPKKNEIIITEGGFIYMDQESPIEENELGEELFPRIFCG
jgi:hypothetical protein